MSVGYDLAGISSDRVVGFLRSMMDAGALVERLRSQIPDEFRRYRGLPFTTRIADSVTLSTFHGCPPGEIEQIAEFLLRDVGIHCIVKLNPTLIGKEEARRLLHDVLGYHALAIPDSAFDGDPAWDQVLAFADRLSRLASTVDRGFGLKFTNTLVVENTDSYFPETERVRYLSGRPLHVLAMQLVARLRAECGDRYRVSFSAGIDRLNFADAVALGLTPVTVCTDLLKPGGYSRAHRYLDDLRERMDRVAARTIDEFIIRAYAPASSRPLGRSEAAVLNAAHYANATLRDERYAQARNTTPPRKIGRMLRLFDCLTCDKCVPVCPNAANFTFVVPPRAIPRIVLWHDATGWRVRRDGELVVAEPHQIGTFVDFCNDCGNCDVFCPEDGGPFRLKPRVFGTVERWRQAAPGDGFAFEQEDASERVFARLDGREYEVDVRGGRVNYRGDGFHVTFDGADPEGTVAGEASGQVELVWYEIMNELRRALLSGARVNWVNAAGKP